MLTLRQLRYLDALARHEHFGRAADECAVSQPALSMQIRNLERELRAELVERRQGTVGLTQIGIEVARRAGAILSAASDLADCTRGSGPVLSGSLRRGVIPTLAPYVLPWVLPELHRRHPKLCLDLLETQTRTLVAELGHGALDVILLALPIDNSGLETSLLFEDRFLLAVPADDPLSEQIRVTTNDVSTRKLMLLEEGHCLRDQALAYCARHDEAETRLGATSLTTVMQMVASGYGVTLVPEIAIDAEVRDKRVKLLRFADPQPQRNIGLAWRQTSSRKADFIALGRIVVETLKVERAQEHGCQLPPMPSRAPSLEGQKNTC
jgi:LysR family transcriptional regulator, hydrogen peroxide-inducible genes activator